MSAGAVVLLKKKLGLNTEKHWLDTLETNVATASTASVMANPMVIPQGDTVNTRNGNTVRMTSLVLKGRIQANTAATAGCLVRVLVVKYNYIHGTTVGVGNVLDQTARITSHIIWGILLLQAIIQYYMIGRSRYRLVVRRMTQSCLPLHIGLLTTTLSGRAQIQQVRFPP